MTDTVGQKKLLISMKELIWILSFLVTIFLTYMKFESRMRALEYRMDIQEKAIHSSEIKFDKINSKLDIISEGITNLKIEINSKEDKAHKF